MKLTGELKKQVEKTDNMDEKKRLIEEAGMELSDEELDQVAGGVFDFRHGDPRDGEYIVRVID